MPTHFRTLSVLTFGASILLGACTIIQDPVTPINPPARQQPAQPPAAPPPATPAPAPAEPGVAVAAPPVATPIPGTPATPVPGTTTTPPPKTEPAPPGATPVPVKPVPVKPRPPLMRIPRLPARPIPVPGKETKPPEHDQPVLPKQPVEPAPSGNGRADGAACSTSSQCASGICEGMGCGWDQGKCAPAQRSCTRDLRLFCGCDGKDFQSSSTCPGRVFRHPGSCNPNR